MWPEPVERIASFLRHSEAEGRIEELPPGVDEPPGPVELGDARGQSPLHPQMAGGPGDLLARTQQAGRDAHCYKEGQSFLSHWFSP